MRENEPTQPKDGEKLHSDLEWAGDAGKETYTVEEAVKQTRKGLRQFAMLFFHICKTLVERFGEDEAFPIAQQVVFSMSCDRAGQIRKRAESEGLPLTLDSFWQANDLPATGWDKWRPCMGGLKCHYAEVWLTYFPDNPWFKRFASMFCDVIDTTNIEVFSGTISHRITSNLLWGDEVCGHDYFVSENVQNGKLTYGTRA